MPRSALRSPSTRAPSTWKLPSGMNRAPAEMANQMIARFAGCRWGLADAEGHECDVAGMMTGHFVTTLCREPRLLFGEAFGSGSGPARDFVRRPYILRRDSVLFRDKIIAIFRLLVPLCLLSGRKLDLGQIDFLIRNQTQEMRNAVQSSPSLVVGVNDVPRRFLGVRCSKHGIARL